MTHLLNAILLMLLYNFNLPHIHDIEHFRTESTMFKISLIYFLITLIRGSERGIVSGNH